MVEADGSHGAVDIYYHVVKGVVLLPLKPRGGLCDGVHCLEDRGQARQCYEGRQSSNSLQDSCVDSWKSMTVPSLLWRQASACGGGPADVMQGLGGREKR